MALLLIGCCCCCWCWCCEGSGGWEGNCEEDDSNARAPSSSGWGAKGDPKMLGKLGRGVCCADDLPDRGRAGYGLVVGVAVGMVLCKVVDSSDVCRKLDGLVVIGSTGVLLV